MKTVKKRKKKKRGRKDEENELVKTKQTDAQK